MTDKKKHTAFRLSAVARYFLGQLSVDRGLNSTAYLEMMIRERAKEAGIEYVPEKIAELADKAEKTPKPSKAVKSTKTEKNGL